MSGTGSGSRKVRFGTFEVDLEIRELRDRGMRVKLQRKPFQILEMLLKNPGSLVTREELMKQLWPNLHVNFDGGLNTAINSLRQVLGDSPRDCRFIETRPGLGYRFLAAVEEVTESSNSANEARGHVPSRSSSFEARQDYLRGKYFYARMTEDDLLKSIAHFESAIAEDGEFALAYAGLADAYCACAVLGIAPPTDAHRRALELVTIALALDDELPEGRVCLGCIKKLFDRDWAGAEAEYLRALHSDPNQAEGRESYAGLLAARGKTEAALKEIRRAQESDPLSLAINSERAWILYMARDFQSAAEQAWKTLVLEPKFSGAQHTLGLAYEQSGLIEEAITELQNARICSGNNPATIAALGHAYAAAGKGEEAWQALQTLEEMSQQRYVSPYWKGVVYSGLGSHELAVQCLEEGYSQKDVWLLWVKVEPRFDPIRGKARFATLVNRLGLNGS